MNRKEFISTIVLIVLSFAISFTYVLRKTETKQLNNTINDQKEEIKELKKKNKLIVEQLEQYSIIIDKLENNKRTIPQ